MSSERLLTVVITCFSHKEFFEAALGSVLAQTYRSSCEILILDNGASDEYKVLIKRAADRLDIPVVTAPYNTYGLWLRSDVLPRITTKFAAFLHDDDLWEPDKIERCLAEMERRELDFHVTNRVYIDASNAFIHPDRMEAVNARSLSGYETRGELLADNLIGGCRIHYSTLTIKTDLMQKTLLGNPFYPRIADAIFWTSLLVDDALKFAVLTDPLTRIRIHSKNDLRYARFESDERIRQYSLLVLSEVDMFEMTIRRASNSVLRDYLTRLSGISIDDEDDRVKTLILATVSLDKNMVSISRTMMAIKAFNLAFEIDALRSLRLLNELADVDVNAFMMRAYDRYLDEFGGYFGETGNRAGGSFSFARSTEFQRHIRDVVQASRGRFRYVTIGFKRYGISIAAWKRRRGL